MFRHPESNPHFLPRQNNDPVIEFPSQTQPPRRSRPPPPHHQTRTSAAPPHGPTRPPPPHHQSRTSVEPPHGPTPQPPAHHPQPHTKLLPPHQGETPPQQHQEQRPRFASEPDLHPPSGRGHNRRHPYLHGPSSRPTRPLAWLVASFCVLFWILVIVGGLIILIVYLVFRPRNPRFDISTATINAAYLDMGYLLNADITVLANFTNPNTKVKVDFSYVVLDLYYDKHVIATRYVEPFSVMKGESRFADVHMVASQVRLSMGQSLDLQKQIEQGRVHFEIRGLFRSKSILGGILHYSYWLYTHCQIVVSGPPTGVLIGKRCVTKR